MDDIAVVDAAVVGPFFEEFGLMLGAELSDELHAGDGQGMDVVFWIHPGFVDGFDEVEEAEAAFDPGFVATEHGGELVGVGFGMGLGEAADLGGFVAWVGVFALVVFDDEKAFDLGVGEVADEAVEFLAVEIGGDPAALSGAELVVAGLVGMRTDDAGLDLAEEAHGIGEAGAGLGVDLAIVRVAVNERGGEGLALAGGESGEVYGG